MSQVSFERVKPSESQIESLFELLAQRLHKISHKETSYVEHKQFVESHPYRDWFLIRVSGNYVGSFYVSKENTIGINLEDEYISLVVSQIINFVKESFKPLPPIPSIRSDKFAVNVPPSNLCLANALTAADAKLAQITYFLPT